MPRTNGKATTLRTVAAAVPPKLADDLEQIARAHDRTVSGELRRVIRAHVEANKSKLAA